MRLERLEPAVNPTLIDFYSGRKGFYEAPTDFAESLQMRSPFSERLVTLRRYLAIAMNDDLTPRGMEELVGVSNGMWGRYESGETRPRRDVIERLTTLAIRHGLDWATAGWLDYNEGEGPPPVATGPIKPLPPPPPPPSDPDEERIIPLGKRGEKKPSQKKKANPRKRKGA